MLNLSLNIQITTPKDAYTLMFDSVASVEIESSWKNLTDTARITLPRHIRLKNSVYNDINDIIVRGSRVEINLGYDGSLKREFTGYVSRVDAKTPFSIECADEMWNLKQTTFSQAWRKVTLKELISFIYKGKSKVVDRDLGSYRIVNSSAAKVLEDLKEQQGIYSFFRYDESLNDVVLNVGLGPYALSTSDKVIYNLNKNVVDNSLTYRMSEDVKIGVTATSVQSDNSKVEVKVGDKDGDNRTLKCPVNLNHSSVTDLAKTFLDQLKVAGYKGSLTGFGNPIVKHGDIIRVEDNMFPERTGLYFADTVKVNFGSSGFRRNVELGYKAG
ncbi:MAG: hypothetical protein P0Y49_15375 [Candidatus Pedobacter colombiensis]|uniref:Uncharacterized protein n=1 Tax=Candidatus Pedobacter colombiensis TaxID=3121371 RepID=A0AAJ5W4W1_9SPHI|nr:hypothetical protein [Pedobacter sp.]WEK18171.1 MAG: hypothetical protein P0Y49_15375 [Pedobacter sp.]